MTKLTQSCIYSDDDKRTGFAKVMRDEVRHTLTLRLGEELQSRSLNKHSEPTFTVTWVEREWAHPPYEPELYELHSDVPIPNPLTLDKYEFRAEVLLIPIDLEPPLWKPGRIEWYEEVGPLTTDYQLQKVSIINRCINWIMRKLN